MTDPPAPWPAAPRLAPEVPLPARPFVPGRDPHPRCDPRGTLYGAPGHAPGLDAARWREDRSYRTGIDFYHAGYLWEAHEAFEACYHATRDAAHRDLLQGLIQLAAALLQAHRGIGAGVRTLARAAHARLAAAGAARERVAGLDPRALADAVARHFAGALGDGDPLVLTGAAPRLEPVG